MFAALAAALALTGAPAATPVTCNPSLTLSGVRGLTYFAPSRVEVDGSTCAAMTLLSMTTSERAKTQALNPDIYLAHVEAEGALTILHELSHVALNSHDETAVECNAMKLLPGYLAAYLHGFDLGLALTWARFVDSTLPANYHERSC
jgi:uncharacterized RmlC-like cupin family protein